MILEVTPYKMILSESEEKNTTKLLRKFNEKRYKKISGKIMEGWTPVDELGEYDISGEKNFEILETNWGEELPVTYVSDFFLSEMKKTFKELGYSDQQIERDLWNLVVRQNRMDFLFYPDKNYFFMATSKERTMKRYEKKALSTYSEYFQFERTPYEKKCGVDFFRWLIWKRMMKDGRISKEIKIISTDYILAYSGRVRIQRFEYGGDDLYLTSEAKGIIIRNRFIDGIKIKLIKSQRAYGAEIMEDGIFNIILKDVEGYRSKEGRNRYTIIRDFSDLIDEIKLVYKNEYKNWNSIERDKFISWCKGEIKKELK